MSASSANSRSASPAAVCMPSRRFRGGVRRCAESGVPAALTMHPARIGFTEGVRRLEQRQPHGVCSKNEQAARRWRAIRTYNDGMVSVDLEFRKGGTVLFGGLECPPELELLESGKRGWLAVSRHIEWRCGWSLRVNCPITEPGPEYKFPRPPSGTPEFDFDPDYCGKLVVSDRCVNVTFQIPDCLDPPKKKSFNWGRPVLIGDRMFHCALRLELRSPTDGTSLRRRAATSARNGAIEFITPGANGDIVIDTIQDSESGRGREERIQAFLEEHRAAYTIGTPDKRGRIPLDNQGFQNIILEAVEFVSSNPSLPEIR